MLGTFSNGGNLAESLKHPSREQVAELVEYLNELARLHQAYVATCILPSLAAYFYQRANHCEGWAMALPQLLNPAETQAQFPAEPEAT